VKRGTKTRKLHLDVEVAQAKLTASCEAIAAAGRRARCGRIIVESSDLDAWEAAGRRLFSLDQDRYRRVLAIAQSYVGIYSDEREEDFRARIAEANSWGWGTRGKA
jgi:hypothetical protein